MVVSAGVVVGCLLSRKKLGVGRARAVWLVPVGERCPDLPAGYDTPFSWCWRSFSSCAEGWTLSRIISILFVSSRAVSFGSGSCFLSLLFSLVCEYGSEQCVVLISH